MYGYTEKELIGRPFYEMIAKPGDAEERKRIYREKFRQGDQIISGELEFAKGDGQPVWIQYTGDFIKHNNKTKYRVSMNIDITKRKQAEEELRRTKEFLDSVIENIPNMIFIKDAKDSNSRDLIKPARNY